MQRAAPLAKRLVDRARCKVQLQQDVFNLMVARTTFRGMARRSNVFGPKAALCYIPFVGNEIGRAGAKSIGQ